MKALQNFPEPKTIRQLRSFLGLASYFRKFIHGFAQIVKPLYEVTNTPSIILNPEQKLAFDRLKTALTEAPVLHLYVRQPPLNCIRMLVEMGMEQCYSRRPKMMQPCTRFAI